MSDLLIIDSEGEIVDLFQAHKTKAGMIRCFTADDITTTQCIVLNDDEKHEVYQTGDGLIFISEGYPAFFTDMFRVNNNGGIRLYNCSSIDMRVIANELGGYGNADCAVVDKIPWEKVDDKGIIQTLLQSESKTGTKNNIEYRLFVLYEFNDQWLELKNIVNSMYSEFLIILNIVHSMTYHLFYQNFEKVISITTNKQLDNII